MIITATHDTISIRLEEQTFTAMLDSLARARAAVIALASPAEPAPVTAPPPTHEQPPAPAPLAEPAPVAATQPPAAPTDDQPPAAAPPAPTQPDPAPEPPPAALIPGADPASDDEIVYAIMEFDALGVEVYGPEQWSAVSAANIKRISNGATETPDQLSIDQLNRLIGGLKRMKASATPAPKPSNRRAARPAAPQPPPANGHSARNYRAEAAQPSNVIMATG